MLRCSLVGCSLNRLLRVTVALLLGKLADRAVQLGAVRFPFLHALLHTLTGNLLQSWYSQAACIKVKGSILHIKPEALFTSS